MAMAVCVSACACQRGVRLCSSVGDRPVGLASGQNMQMQVPRSSRICPYAGRHAAIHRPVALHRLWLVCGGLPAACAESGGRRRAQACGAARCARLHSLPQVRTPMPVRGDCDDRPEFPKTIARMTSGPQPCFEKWLNRLMPTGPSITVSRAGKMQNTNGISSFTGSLAAASSARRRR